MPLLQRDLLTALFKLKIQNVLLAAIVPTVASKYYYENEIHERVDQLWRIHRNRVDRGLGSTADPRKFYENKMIGESSKRILQGLQMSFSDIISGYKPNYYLDAPFKRMRNNVLDHNTFLDDMDDVDIMESGRFERFKNKGAAPGSCDVEGTIVPPKDTDEEFVWADV